MDHSHVDLIGCGGGRILRANRHVIFQHFVNFIHLILGLRWLAARLAQPERIRPINEPNFCRLHYNCIGSLSPLLICLLSFILLRIPTLWP